MVKSPCQKRSFAGRNLQHKARKFCADDPGDDRRLLVNLAIRQKLYCHPTLRPISLAAVTFNGYVQMTSL